MPAARIAITPAWVFRNDAGEEVDHRLFRLLQGVHEAGKLTLAARRAGISYRHAWNILARWSDFFGNPLVALTQGKGAALTPLGEKLVWAEARASARLLPQLENIASELNLELHRAIAEGGALVRVHASYGYGVAKLPELVRGHAGIELDLQYFPAADSLASLARGECDIAGFHVPEGERGRRAVELYRGWLDPAEQTLVYLVRRQQGLYVAPRNPRRIEGLGDLVRRDVRFVNRQRGSGTRVLLDTLLQEQKIPASAIEGYATEEFTHAAVAAYVASGMADVGMGVEPAARQFGLGFVPIAGEHYFLVCRRRTLALPAVDALVRLLRGKTYRDLVATLPGYRGDRAGELVALDDALPWLATSSRSRTGARPRKRRARPATRSKR
jgi:putative molybdopterin biosynthesis protein